MNGLIRRSYLFDKITELEKETKDRIRKVHLGSAEYQRYMEQLNERSLMKKMILTAPAVPDTNVGDKWSEEKRKCDMERLTTRHCEVAVIKDKSKLKEAMEKLAVYEDAEEKNIKTNGDMIRSMSDEQLAYLFASIKMPDEDMMIICEKDFFAEDEILDWLKEETEQELAKKEKEHE